jgi:hypothetical protein
MLAPKAVALQQGNNRMRSMSGLMRPLAAALVFAAAPVWATLAQAADRSETVRFASGASGATIRGLHGKNSEYA